MLTTIVNTAACPVISFSFISIYVPLDIITVKLLTHISTSNHFETVQSSHIVHIILHLLWTFFWRCDMKLMWKLRMGGGILVWLSVFTVMAVLNFYERLSYRLLRNASYSPKLEWKIVFLKDFFSFLFLLSAGNGRKVF